MLRPPHRASSCIGGLQRLAASNGLETVRGGIDNGEKDSMNNKTGKLAATLIAAVLTAGMASGAFAQASGVTTGGTGSVDESGLPEVQQQGAVSYTSGGVGLDESQALRREQAHWPLSLRFTGPTADYLSNVHVRVVGQSGEVLSAEAMGPYMLVKLAPGSYTVYAKYKDQEKTQKVTVAGPGKAKAAFHWSIQ
jgi:hypothetical protein